MHGFDQSYSNGEYIPLRVSVLQMLSFIDLTDEWMNRLPISSSSMNSLIPLYLRCLNYRSPIICVLKLNRGCSQHSTKLSTHTQTNLIYLISFTLTMQHSSLQTCSSNSRLLFVCLFETRTIFAVNLRVHVVSSKAYSPMKLKPVRRHGYTLRPPSPRHLLTPFTARGISLLRCHLLMKVENASRDMTLQIKMRSMHRNIY
jgi:hypothetical protein